MLRLRYRITTPTVRVAASSGAERSLINELAVRMVRTYR
jgi:hypothetical protein